MHALTHRSIETNGIRLSVALQGDGPLVLLCHGFPESSHPGATRPPASSAPRDGRWFDTLIDPAPLPAWLTPADFTVFSDAFARSGFRGPLNWYRAIDRTWELMAPWHNAPVTVPALFLCGAEDRGLLFYRPAVEALPQTVPLLTRRVLLPGCGHWIQQERPDEVNAALLEFLAVVAPPHLEG